MNPLQARVHARNTVHKVANDFFPIIAEALKPFIGTQIIKADGGFMKKFKDKLPQSPYNHPWLRSHYEDSGNSFKVNFSQSAMDDKGHSTYADCVLYVAKTSNGVLVELEQPPNFETNFTEESVTQARQAVAEAKKALSNAQGNHSFYYFGEWDR